ncbi:MAG: hypothetical protein LUQ38_07490 [Methanotrichaceae archaeon]|nr:hypothetical protein [Methanotrichaceae archaeon]
MAKCKLCQLTSPLVSSELGLCSNCLIENPEESIPIAMQAHRKSREVFGLPVEPPKAGAWRVAFAQIDAGSRKEAGAIAD